MDVEITTTHPSEVDAEEVARALEDAGYFVHSVKVFDRANILHHGWEV